MTNKNIQSNTELPSMGKLIKSTVLAIAIAAVLLVTVVLPAEYGIDPLGVGEIIGLVKMGQIKTSLAQEAAQDRASAEAPPESEVDRTKPASAPESTAVPPQSEANLRTDEITISLIPDEGKEIKLTMKEGAQVNYSWWTDGGKANFDAHADSKPLKISYHNYEKGSAKRSEGMLEAAFDGNHGWFWRNRTSEPMKVTLKVSGSYTDVVQY